MTLALASEHEDERPLDLLRERVIRAVTYRRGVGRVVNGIPFRVASPVRAVFTSNYDQPVAEFLRRQIQPGSEVWNVGANVGVYVLQLASWVGPTGRVVAFEPNPHAREFLRENLRLNNLAERVEVIEAAVGGENGHVDFFVEGADGMGRAGEPNPLLTHATAVRVPVTTLDTFLERRSKAPAWIMMDIEGWEIAALRGARRLLKETPVAAELHPSAWEWSGHSRADLADFLEEMGLCAVPLAGQLDPLAEHGQVFFDTRNAVRR